MAIAKNANVRRTGNGFMPDGRRRCRINEEGLIRE
jgi:hypothetical protein